MGASQVAAAALVGIGATLIIDAWGLMLRRAFGIPSLNICFLGRWVLHMPSGTFMHASIGAASSKSGECVVGWTMHYLIGATFGVLFVALAGAGWLARPTLLPALAFGVVTVLVPLLTMQPAFGLGVAASKTPHPNQARLKSLATHTVFGAGLFAWGCVLNLTTLAPPR